MNDGARLLKGAPGSQGAKARRLDITPAMMSMLVNGHRTPGEELRRRIEAQYKVPFASWEQGERGPEVPPERASEASAERPAGELAVLCGGSPLERAQALLDYLSKPGRTSTELKQAAELRHALHHEARLRGALSAKAKLHEHPDWPTFVEKILDAVESPEPMLALHKLLKQSEVPAQEAA